MFELCCRQLICATIVGIEDPLRPGVIESVQKCVEALIEGS